MKFNLTIPQSDLASAYNTELHKLSRHLKIKGFRQGKAPLNLVADAADQKQLYEAAFKQVFPLIYTKYCTDHHLHPITNPKITLTSAETNSDWLVEVEIAQKPTVKLNQYQTAVKKVNLKWKQPPPKKTGSNPKSNDQDHLNAILACLTTTCEVTVPNLLINDSVDHELSHLLDQVAKLGLSLDAYLASTKKTPAQLRQEYALQAESDLKLDFIFDAIAESKKLQPSSKEINQFILKIEDPQLRSRVEKDTSVRSSLYSTLLRSHVVDYLKAL